MWKRLHAKYPLFLSDFNEIYICSTDFRNKPKLQISSKSVQWESSCSMRTDWRTDVEKLIVAFRNFAKASRTYKCLETDEGKGIQDWQMKEGLKIHREMKKSQLNAKNRITAEAALSVPVLRYSSGIIKLVIENTRTAAHSRCYNGVTNCADASTSLQTTIWEELPNFRSTGSACMVQFLWCEVRLQLRLQSTRFGDNDFHYLGTCAFGSLEYCAWWLSFSTSWSCRFEGSSVTALTWTRIASRFSRTLPPCMQFQNIFNNSCRPMHWSSKRV